MGLRPAAFAAAWLAAAAPAAAGSRQLPASSDGVHAWIVVERTRAAGTEHVLLHHASDMGCDCVHEAFALPRAPEAVAAHGGTVWVVLPAEPGGRRDVFSLSVRRNPATGAYFTEPAGRMEIHPSLPADGALLAAAAPEGVLTVRRAGTPPESLSGLGWRPAGEAGAELVPAPADAFRSPIPGAALPAALVRGEGGGRSIVYVRQGADLPLTDLPLADLPLPQRPFAVLGLGWRFGVFAPTGDGGAAVRWVDGVDGTVGEQVVLEPQPASAAWACTSLAAVAATGMFAGLAAWRLSRLKSVPGERR